MRLTIILIVLVALLLGAQGRYQSRKAAQSLALARAMLPEGCEGALDVIRPTFRYSGVLTLGGVGRRHREFAQAVRDSVIGPVTSGRELDSAWFRGVVPMNLRVLHRLETEHGLETRQERLDIMNALREETPALRSRQHVAAWNGFAEFVRNAESDPAVPLDGIPDYESWRADVLGTDIRPIALRQGLEKGIECLEKARAALASDPVAGTRLARLKRPADPQAVSEANRQADAGQSQIRIAMGALGAPGEIDPELRGVWIRLAMNRSASFLGHLIDMGPDERRDGTPLLYDLYIHPDSDVLPSAAEMYGSFSGSIQSALIETVERIEEGFLEGREDEAELHALALWTLAQYWNTTGHRARVDETFEKFKAVQGAAAATPEGAALTAELLAGDYVYIVTD